NNLTGKQLAINYQSAYLYLGLIAIILFCGLSAGSYPAFYLASLKSLDTMRGIINKNPGNARFRRALVIFQFSLSILLIVCTLIIGKQLYYLQNKKLGFYKDDIGYFACQTPSKDPRLESIKKELGSHPDILSVTTGFNPNENEEKVATTGFSWKGRKEDDYVPFCISSIDVDYAKTFQLALKQGRFFSSEFSTDSAAVVINETAAKVIGLEDPIGLEISDGSGRKYNIIGVVRDFHFKSMHQKIDPLLMMLGADRFIFIKMKHGASASIIRFVGKTFESYKFPNRLDFHFLENDLDSLYRPEQRMSKIFGYFSLLAIIISCLGLIGLAAFMAERRTKEIGIRKANGAKSNEIFALLSKEYVMLVIISLLIASPVAWYAMHKWLENFAYKTIISWWVFALTAILVMLITMLTISLQSYRAARRNPGGSIKVRVNK
ncbi:MAG TPA: FtsX-like permease family protein, partial [Bacteroidales bacterium]|nr:FtsX-like permease family protein [Bacteroidales bacterium]